MTFAQPWALIAAAGAVAVVVALHFIARRKPRAMRFPTARFVPARSVRAPSRSTRPSDLPLLLLRVLALLLLGAAFARPTLDAERRPLARVVVLDLSASGSSTSAARDSAAHYLRTGDLLVAFDSAARLIAGDARDSVTALEGSRARGSLSGALVAAARASSRLRARADSLELVLVSPLVGEEWDGATGAIRSLWPGGVRVVRTERARDSVQSHTGRPSVKPRAVLDDDPVRVVAELMPDTVATANVRVVRGAPDAADSAWASEAGHVLVFWPATAPEGWRRRERPDTVGAVVAGSAVLIADFARSVAPPGGGRVVARWLDGAPAAVERAVGEGCVREVAVPFPTRGDLALREIARHFMREMVAPCGGTRDLASLGGAQLDTLRDGAQAAGAQAPKATERGESRATPWLLAAAALLLLLELLLRRSRAGAEMEVGS